MQYTIQRESHRIICSQLEKCFLSILEDARQGSYIQREHSLALGRTVYRARIYTNIYISGLYKYLQILSSTLNYKYGTIINFIYMRTFGRTYVYIYVYYDTIFILFLGVALGISISISSLSPLRYLAGESILYGMFRVKDLFVISRFGTGAPAIHEKNLPLYLKTFDKLEH